MKSMKKLVTSLLLSSMIGLGQPPNPQQIAITAPVPNALANLSSTIVGGNGFCTYYYYIAINYPIGSVMSGGFRVQNAPCTISGGNYIRLNWTAVTGATNYSIVRGTSANLFTAGATSGTCVNCRVVLNLAATTYNDTTNTLTNPFTLSGPSQSTIQFFLNNRDYATPELIGNNIQGPTVPFVWTQLGGGGIQCLTVDNNGKLIAGSCTSLGAVSITAGTGISVSPNPITGVGVITNTAPGGGGPAGPTFGNFITHSTTDISGDNIGQVGFTWENKLAIQGGTSGGALIFIYDVSNNTANPAIPPVLISTIIPHEGASSLTVRAISVYGQFLHFISCTGGNVCFYETFNINNYTSPVWVASLAATDFGASIWTDAKIVGNRLYIGSDGSPNLWSFDATDWSNPKIISSITLASGGGDVFVDDSFIYKAGDHNASSILLSVVSIDPITGILTLAGTGTYGAADIYTSTSISKRGDYIYTAVGTTTGEPTCPCKSFLVWDVKNPATPTVVGTYQNPQEAANPGLIASPHLIIYGSIVFQDIGTFNSGATIGCVVAVPCGVDVIDISNPLLPTRITSYAFPSTQFPNALFYGSGGYVYSLTFDWLGVASNTLKILQIPGLQVPSADIGSLHVTRLEADEIVRSEVNLIGNTVIKAGTQGIGSQTIISAREPGGNIPTCKTFTVSNNGTNWTIATTSGTTIGAAIAGAATQAITLFALPDRAKVVSTEQHTTTVWSGTGFTSITSKIQDSIGGAGFYDNTAYQLTTAVSNTNFQDVGGLYKSATFAGSNVQAFLTANQNLNTNTITGATDYTVCWVMQP